MKGTPVQRTLLTMSIGIAVLMSACGGGGDSADVTTTLAAPTTTTTAPATTTTTEPPTTTTTEPEPAAPTVEELADMIVLESGFFGTDWEEVPQTDSDFSYGSIDGCQFLADLIDADGHTVEAESPSFGQFDTEIEHDVRVYPRAETAIDVVLAWTQAPTLDCLLEGTRVQAQESLDNGELAPFTGVDFEITRYDDLVGEPRFTRFEVINTLSGPDGEVVIVIDIYLMQVGRSVSRVLITTPTSSWDQTDQLLDVILQRMVAADEADTA